MVVKAGPWSQDDDVWLRENYAKLGARGCALYLGRTTKAVVNHACVVGVRGSRDSEAHVAASKAHSARLTGRKRPEQALVMLRNWADGKFSMEKRRGDLTPEQYSKTLSDAAKERIAKNGHPRGATGMRHTAETKRRIAEKSRQAWLSKTED